MSYQRNDKSDHKIGLIIPKARLQKTNNNFFVRAAKLMNVVRRTLGINDNLIPDKQTIETIRLCTWRILYNCKSKLKTVRA